MQGNEQQLTEEANRLFRDGKLAEAERRYSQMLAEEPENYQVLMMLGLCRQGQGDRDGALEHFRQAARLGDNDPETHFHLGRMLLENGQADAARESLVQTLALNPNHAPARTIMGLLALGRGDASRAVEELRAAVRAGANYAPAHATLALALVETGDLQKAHDHAKEAVRLDENGAAPQTALGRVFLAQGHAAFAEQCFRNALGGHPENPELNAGMGSALQASGRHEEALEYFARAARGGLRGVRLALDSATSLEATDRVPQARQLLEQAHARMPEHAGLIRRLAELRLADGDAGGAGDLADALDGDVPENRLVQARIRHARGDAQGARELLESLDSADDPETVRQARLTRARMLRPDGDLDALESALGPLITGEAPDAEAVLLWANACRAGSSGERATPALEALVASGAGDGERLARIHAMLAEIRDAAGDYTAAAEHLAATGWRPSPTLQRLQAQREAGLEEAWKAFDGGFPDQPPEDGRSSPLVVLGWPGSGREIVLGALGVHQGVQVLDAATIDRRRQALGLPAMPEALQSLDTDSIRMGRRRFLRGTGTGLLLDSAWWEVTALPALARYFPGARVMVPAADSRDLELHWRFAGYRDIAAMRAALDAERDLLDHLRERLPLEFIEFDRAALTDDPEAGIQAVCKRLDLTPSRLMRERAIGLRLAQPYRPDGHWQHYSELIGGAG